mgnify:CR=1 FL=1
MGPLRSSYAVALTFCLFLTGFAANVQATDDIPTLFDPKVKTLDNGLEVVVLEDHRAPIVTHMVWYKIGAADEKPLKSGQE